MMQRWVLGVAFAVAAQPVWACEGMGPEAGASTSVGRMADVVWQLRSVDGVMVPEGADVWLNVDPMGKVSGRSGCNRFSGSVELDAGMMIFGPLAATRMACAPEAMELEGRVLAALGEVRGFAIGPDGLLWLTREDGSVAICGG